MAASVELRLNHVARETSDLQRLARFYEEVLGFNQIEAPDFGEFKVIWLKLSNSLCLHLIERNPSSLLPEGPYSASSDALREPRLLRRGHHIALSVSNYDAFITKLKEKGILFYEAMQPDGKTRQVFFFDPDGNGLEVTSAWPPSL
eukprot:TRINITY_DN1911_c0_g3_i1.p1 TRINITY_DN1911_c0_g3~~TRINITY_DN1911_c0_g3_i1.p1  ORF type:complete len:146 (+),score=15.81 TRINITY_DN1911_c0_g3_i1:129-566(+)